MPQLSSTSALDPETTALLVIDVQRGLFSRSTPIYQAQTLLQKINALIEKFRGAHALRVFIQHSNDKLLVKNTESWRFHPDLRVADDDIVIHKLHGDAFEETELKQVLEGRGIETLVITGLVTHGCVKATCLGALELGYRVVMAQDAHSSYSKDAARLIEEWNRKLGEQGARQCKAEEIVLS